MAKRDESQPTVRLFNSLTNQVEDFQVHDNTVRMYVCGITPYDVTHLGHALSYVSYDTLRRYFEHLGVRVIHVQNVTDIDDDMVRKSRELGRSIAEIRDENVAWFEEDMRALNVLPPTHNPRATEVIPEIIDLVSRLEAAGAAYAVDGDVYFSVRSFDRYGHLVHLPLDQIAQLENPEVGKRPGQRDPLDFLLWQRGEEDAPAWDSPWGPGRPGWSAECSAMCLKFLGEQVDIHGGGRDLVYPHHQNEIAQSETATGKVPFARFWVHNGMLRIDGEKMSKSLKNLVLVKDLIQRYRPDALRLYLQKQHYRSDPQWSEKDLAATEGDVDLLLAAARQEGSAGGVDPEPYRQRFCSALEDDLDTPQAIEQLLGFAEVQAAGNGGRAGAETVTRLARLLGLRLAG